MFNVTKLTEENFVVSKNQIAAHITPDVTEDEMREIINFIEYIKSKRNSDK